MSLFDKKAEVETTTLASGKTKTTYGNGVVTARKPTAAEIEAMLFAWRVVKHTKSNAIALATGESTVGIGMGQTNRIWATEQAIAHAGDKAKGAALASDAFSRSTTACRRRLRRA